MIGETVGSYRITAKVSVGGMGSVYRAEHVLIGKIAAVKVLHPELSSNKDIVQRFFNEAKATTAIKHPGIVEVFDFGHMGSGEAYLVMEFLEGMSLARRIKTRGKMSEGDAAMLLRPLCSALQAAHDKGIVHRDLKPDNVYLVADPEAPMGMRPKILDFGIAKLTDIGLATSATKTGAVMGTPTYMSPEQCKGTGEVDHRADLYSLGCIFYELVTGRPPFTNRGAGELIGAHLYVTPEPPSKHNPAVSTAGEALILSLLQKDPAARPQTAKELGSRFAKLAETLGWGTGPITQPELADLPIPDNIPTTADLPEVATAAVRPNALPPPEYSVVITPGPKLVEVTDKPTTLSGAASQSAMQVHPPAPKRRTGWLVGAAAAIVVIGVGVTVALNRGSGDADGPRASGLGPRPEPAPVVHIEPTKQDVPPPAHVEPPVPAHVETPPPADPPPPPAPIAPVPEKPKPVDKPRPARVDKPVQHVDKPKPTVAKPTETQPPPKPQLIETDI